MPFASLLLAAALAAKPIILNIDATRAMATFDPHTAFGATIDVHEPGDNARIFTPPNVEAMRSAGFQPLSYRLATELGNQAWHWNPAGTWSDAAHQRGYWKSNDTSDAPIEVSHGYRLPRRGDTFDQAHQGEYSRIDDGDPSTFWKSNPYLDEHFTGEPDDRHPQWILVDLEAYKRVDAIRITWASPYAVEYSVGYWFGRNPFLEQVQGHWIEFQHGAVRDGKGGRVTLRLADAPVSVRFLRVAMTRSSHTPAAESNGDVRDSLGYAVAELSIGTTAGGRFHDLMKHGRSNTTQTRVEVSSTDPWHRATDRDDRMEQPGFDLVFRTGLANGQGVLMPVALLFGTPEDSAAQIRFLEARGYPLSMIEMGEEPDGQLLGPEDYGVLYRQWAKAIHAVDPALKLGGPAFQSTIDYVGAWPNARGETSWIGRFLSYLRQYGEEGDFTFFSFEWYPFDNLCVPAQPQLVRAPSLLPPLLNKWKREGLPTTIPWLVTEYGYSAHAGEPEVSIVAALFNSEFLAQYMSLGGTAAYYYGLEPEILLHEQKCPTWGNLMLFLADDDRRIRHPVAAYYGAKLVTQEWAMSAGPHSMYPIAGTSDLLTAYAVKRPDQHWAVLVINKDDKEPRSVRFRVDHTEAKGPVEIVQYSSREYVWHADGEDGYAKPNRPPRKTHLSALPAEGIELPPYSVTVVRW
ncbi:MAG TPA: discoidin domain-containing protein [Thermoanaerobaculia bacterium]|nr:discoidin domain-containing protein [Thermoanaerobaculia bacterium]